MNYTVTAQLEDYVWYDQGGRLTSGAPDFFPLLHEPLAHAILLHASAGHTSDDSSAPFTVPVSKHVSG